MTIAGVVLAAGASTRLGEPKQLLRDHNDETLVHKVAREALEVGLQPVIVVVGANAKLISLAVSDLDVVVQENEQWMQGISSSIRAGISAATHDEILGALFLTCDMPSVGKSHLRLLIDAAQNGKYSVASTYGDTIGIPAIVRASEFANLQLLQGDKGAKSLFTRNDTVLVTLQNGIFDLDTQEDVAKWRAAGSQ